MKMFGSLLFFLLAIAHVHGDASYARPIRDFQIGFPVETRSLKLYPLTKLTLHRQTDDAVFVTLDDESTIYKLSRFGDNGRSLFEQKGDLLAPLEMLHLEVDQRWLLFSSKTDYPIIDDRGDQLTLGYPQGNTVTNLKLPKAYFKIYTREEINEAQSQAQSVKAHNQQLKTTHLAQRETPPLQLTPEQRRHRQAEQELKSLQSQAPTPHRITTTAAEAACIVENVRGSGSGFLAVQDGHIYLFTNIHMLTSGGGGLTAKLVNGRQLKLGSIELARDRDLARIAILTPNLPALEFDYAPQINESITAYGNSSGGNVITELSGKVLGIGPTEIEITAEVVHGNSGGPILNQTGQVLGVVTRGMTGSSSRMAQGTRFSLTRRFAARVSLSIQWDVASYRNLVDCERELGKGKQELREFEVIANVFSQSWGRSISNDNLTSVNLAHWAKSHNNLVSASGQIDGDDLRAEVASMSQRLGSLPYQRARYYQHFKLYPENPYYRHQLNELADRYAAYNDLGKTYADSFSRNPPQVPSKSSPSSRSTNLAFNPAPIDLFQQKDKTTYAESGGRAYCLAVCKGIRSNDVVQLVFSASPGSTGIMVDAYVDGVAYVGTVNIVVNGRNIMVSRALSIEDFAAVAKALRREVHLGPKSSWAEGYQMLGDRPLHQLIDYAEGQ